MWLVLETEPAIRNALDWSKAELIESTACHHSMESSPRHMDHCARLGTTVRSIAGVWTTLRLQLRGTRLTVRALWVSPKTQLRGDEHDVWSHIRVKPPHPIYSELVTWSTTECRSWGCSKGESLHSSSYNGIRHGRLDRTGARSSESLTSPDALEARPLA